MLIALPSSRIVRLIAVTVHSCLAGLIAPTSGDCSIHGFSILRNMKEIRKSLGICPQQNVLWSRLTVAEHLRIYATLKGVKDEVREEEVMRKIEEVGLSDKKDIYSSALSGGMQRKLQCAMAFIGDSKVVFLDEYELTLTCTSLARIEQICDADFRAAPLVMCVCLCRPTSGMDPYSRRSTWELLRNAKKDRVIVLTVSRSNNNATEALDAVVDWSLTDCCFVSVSPDSLHG